MFNTTVNHYLPRELQVRIDERRAPTDDSIRLYGEMRDKAVSSVLSVGAETFGIDKIRWAISDAPEINGIRLDLNFNVDGRECHEQIYYSAWDVTPASDKQKQADEIIEKIEKRVVAAVSREITKQLFKRMAGQIGQALLK